MTKDPNQTERPPTGAAPLGLPDRTILEGFEPPTRPTGHSRQGSSRSERNNRPGGNSRPGGSIRQESSQSERNDNAGGNSRPGSSRQNPRGLGSASEYERSRRSQPAAARSSGFVSTAPSHARSLFINQSEAKMASRQTQYESLPPEQRAKQETWAQSFLKREGRCPQDFGWQRVEGIGYQCEGLNHLITDELVAEGKGGFMVLREENPYFPAMGPYYEMAGRPGWFKYAGPEPRWPDVVDEASLPPHRKGENEALDRAKAQNPFFAQQLALAQQLAVRKLAIQKADAEFLKNMSTSEQQEYFVRSAIRRGLVVQPGSSRRRRRRTPFLFNW
jgi:hypothetical protein